MTSLNNHQSNSTVKLLLLGNSGDGKSGSLASLAKAGYKLFILDYDNGLDVLVNVLKREAPDKIANVHYKTLTETYMMQGTTVVPKAATAFVEGMRLLDKWTEGGVSLGSVSTWGSDTVLVLDSLSLLSRAAMSQTLQLNGRLAAGPTQSDWYHAQNAIENVLALLFSDAVKCNVIITAHTVQIEDGNGINQGFPQTLGKALSPRVGRYFNSMLLCKTTGAGPSKKRIIRTVPDGTVSVKHPMPGSGLAADLPIETGLATFFACARGEGQPSAGAATPSPIAAAAPTAA